MEKKSHKQVNILPDITGYHQVNEGNFFEDDPVIEFVNSILFDACKNKASDIHFEPYENQYRLRYRQNGFLVEQAPIPTYLINHVTARIKVMSNLNIAEQRMPQDGHFKLNYLSNIIDCRVSSCPTVCGEKIVIRLLDINTLKMPIEQLGFNTIQKNAFLYAINRIQGLILVTGPTGSGKTISLYTALHILNNAEKNILTVEDPVEIKMAGINQVQIQPKIGLNFAKILRAFLRQDPDVIMIGEIRDHETAAIAVQAAQTGHLVLATLHANNVVETLTRLKNLRISAVNMAHAVNILIGQRLLRCLCQMCKIKRHGYPVTQLTHLGFDEKTASTMVLYEPKGCAHCIDGYSGRTAIFEVLPISKLIATFIQKGAKSSVIFRLAQQEGMTTMYQSGLEKIAQGITTIEEVLRVSSR